MSPIENFHLSNESRDTFCDSIRSEYKYVFFNTPYKSINAVKNQIFIRGIDKNSLQKRLSAFSLLKAFVKHEK